MERPSNIIVPTVYEVTERGTRASDIYSKLLDDRIVFLNGAVEEYNTNLIVAQLLYLDSVSNDDITIYINSPGGSVFDGLQVIDTMNLIKSDVATIVTGLAASMGFAIASNGTKGKRFSLPHGNFMMHQVSSGNGGNISDMRISHAHTEILNERLMQIIANNCGKTLKQILKDSDRDKWFDAKQSIKYGVIDSIITKR